MKICGISVFKGSTMCVEAEDGRRFYIHETILSGYDLREGMEISEETAAEIMRANELRKAKERALYLLDMRDHSFVEMYKKLEKSYSGDIALEVCKYLAGARLINDRRYAENLAEQLFEKKCFGSYRARLEMKRRGLSDSVIEEAAAPYDNEEASQERLERLVEKKYERFLTDEKGVKRVKNSLLRQGYSYREINAVLELYDLDL